MRGEVDDLLEALRRDVEQVAEPARDALEVPDVRDGRGELDVAHALATDLRARDLDATALADDALEPDALVLAAVALPVLGRTEDLLAEQAVLLRLERAVVDRLGLLHLAVATTCGSGRRWRARWTAVRSRSRRALVPRLSLSVCSVVVLLLLVAERRFPGRRLPRRCPVRAARGRCRGTRWCGRRPRRARGSRPLRPLRSSRGR